MGERRSGTTTHYRTKSGERAWIVLGFMALALLGWVGLGTDGFGLLGSSENDDEQLAVDLTPEPTETIAKTSSPTSTTTPTPDTEPLPPLPPRPTPEPTAPLPTPDLEPDIEAMAREAGCEIAPLTLFADPARREWANYWYSAGSEGRGVRTHASTPADDEVPLWYAESGLQWFAVTPLPDDDLVTGRNLEDGSRLEPFQVSPDRFTQPGQIALGRVDFPSAGCWELTVNGDTLTVYVLPEEEAPFLTVSDNQRSETRPYEPPETCEVDEWHGPIYEFLFPSGYWLIENGIELGSTYGVFFTGSNRAWLTHQHAEDLAVAGVHREGSNTGMRSSQERVPNDYSLRYWRLDLDFPEAGCWDLRISVGEHQLSTSVYVFES